MGDWQIRGVRPNASRALVIAAVLAMIASSTSCASAHEDTEPLHNETAIVADGVTAPDDVQPSGAATDEPVAVPADASARAEPPGLGLIACSDAFGVWATTAAGLDVDTEQRYSAMLVPAAWNLAGLGAPSCAFSGVRDGADPLTSAQRRVTTSVLAYVSDSPAVLDALYADARAALDRSTLAFASESADSGLRAVQYFHDDGGTVDATVTATVRLNPPFAAEAGLARGVGLIIVRGMTWGALAEE